MNLVFAMSSLALPGDHAVDGLLRLRASRGSGCRRSSATSSARSWPSELEAERQRIDRARDRAARAGHRDEEQALDARRDEVAKLEEELGGLQGQGLRRRRRDARQTKSLARHRALPVRASADRSGDEEEAAERRPEVDELTSELARGARRRSRSSPRSSDAAAPSCAELRGKRDRGRGEARGAAARASSGSRRGIADAGEGPRLLPAQRAADGLPAAHPQGRAGDPAGALPRHQLHHASTASTAA